MRLLAIADIHANRTKLRQLLAEAGRADVIVLAGDLTNFGSPDEAAEAVALCQPYAPSVLTVTGNCDDELIERRMVADGHSLTGQGCVVDGVGFFGVSAAAPHRGNTWEVSEEVIAGWLESGHRAVVDAPRKILVSHPPPFGLADLTFAQKHGGSHAVRAALEQYAVQLVICGHIHEARGMAQCHNTIVVNCGPAGRGYYAVVEVGEQVRVELREMK